MLIYQKASLALLVLQPFSLSLFVGPIARQNLTCNRGIVKT